MLGSAIIVFREVLEAALIVGIVLAAARDVVGRGRWVALGIVAGVSGALLVAAGAETISAAFEGVGQELLNAVILLCAVGMLAFHVVWMQRHGADLARHLRTVSGDVGTGARPLHALAVVVGLAVLREGSEVVLFLHGIAAGGSQGGALLTGALLGLLGGAAVGALLYFGLLRIPPRHLFAVTNWLIVALAAGMAGQAAAALVQAGVLPPLLEPAWDSSALLPEHSALGQLLRALVGYDDRPSAMQLVAFAATFIGIVLLSRWLNASAQRTRHATAVPAVLVAAGLAAYGSDARADHIVYSPLVEQGEIAVELRGHHDFDGDDSRDGAEAYKIDLEWAPLERWRTELLGEFEREPGEDLQTTEVAWENIFQLTDQGRYWADFGLLAEYAHSLEDDGHDKLELGLLGQKEFGRNEARLNLIFEREFESGADFEMEYRWQYRYRLAERFEPGLEMYGELGEWGDTGSFDDHEHQLGPAIFGKLRVAGGAIRYEAGLLFGLSDESPDTTARFVLEYEF